MKFKTQRKESMKTRFFRLGMNAYPMYFGTGGRILFIAADWREVHLKLTLNMWSKNYVGTIFGGSMFSACDPFYMLMLFHALGPEFVVWDKTASIRFKKPGKKPLYLKCELTDEVLNDIKEKIAADGKCEYNFEQDWKDEGGHVVASLTRTLYVASKEFYKLRAAKR